MTNKKEKRRLTLKKFKIWGNFKKPWPVTFYWKSGLHCRRGLEDNLWRKLDWKPRDRPCLDVSFFFVFEAFTRINESLFSIRFSLPVFDSNLAKNYRSSSLSTKIVKVCLCLDFNSLARDLGHSSWFWAFDLISGEDCHRLGPHGYWLYLRKFQVLCRKTQTLGRRDILVTTSMQNIEYFIDFRRLDSNANFAVSILSRFSWFKLEFSIICQILFKDRSRINPGLKSYFALLIPCTDQVTELKKSCRARGNKRSYSRKVQAIFS